ncbi:hypothetical protein DFJ58DRAFT_841166 [Suillus subalutaceus]|uniref:uncharacterized protein n=1 Tax=Suillus subalutaceus TaxID=48586 RepID=UPI001B879ADC|nr:uncharacterized protein DFJ58DRAFT_841166 [Suillus subalutaceus]KAG1855145.1 hypothetical protein DFJ58DRAFT_841166 [Suillus subalutaceus]
MHAKRQPRTPYWKCGILVGNSGGPVLYKLLPEDAIDHFVQPGAIKHLRIVTRCALPAKIEEFGPCCLSRWSERKQGEYRARRVPKFSLRKLQSDVVALRQSSPRHTMHASPTPTLLLEGGLSQTLIIVVITSALILWCTYIALPPLLPLTAMTLSGTRTPHVETMTDISQIQVTHWANQLGPDLCVSPTVQFRRTNNRTTDMPARAPALGYTFFQEHPLWSNTCGGINTRLWTGEEDMLWVNGIVKQQVKDTCYDIITDKEQIRLSVWVLEMKLREYSQLYQATPRMAHSHSPQRVTTELLQVSLDRALEGPLLAEKYCANQEFVNHGMVSSIGISALCHPLLPSYSHLALFRYCAAAEIEPGTSGSVPKGPRQIIQGYPRHWVRQILPLPTTRMALESPSTTRVVP